MSVAPKVLAIVANVALWSSLAATAVWFVLTIFFHAHYNFLLGIVAISLTIGFAVSGYAYARWWADN